MGSGTILFIYVIPSRNILGIANCNTCGEGDAFYMPLNKISDLPACQGVLPH